MVVSLEHVVQRASPPRLLAEHALRGELLRAAGWHVVHLWLSEWGQLGDAQKRARYLGAALHAVGVQSLPDGMMGSEKQGGAERRGAQGGAKLFR